MDVDCRAAVRVSRLLIIDLGEPVVGCDGTGVGQDQTADAVCHGGVLLDAPVVDLQIVVDKILVAEHRALDITDLLALFTVQDVCFGYIGISGLGENLLRAVLDILNRDHTVLDLGLEITGHTQCQHIDHRRVILLITCYKSLLDRLADLGNIKIDNHAIALQYPVHSQPPTISYCVFKLSVHIRI